jgi:hypothetical protein
MRLRTVAVLLGLMTFAAASAAGDPLPWEKILGGEKDDLLLSAVALPDGGYAVGGGTASKGAGQTDFWALRLDAKGNVVWDKTFGGPKDDSPTRKALAALPDGGFALAGGTYSKGAGDADVWVVRLDGNGNVLWDRTFGARRRRSLPRSPPCPTAAWRSPARTSREVRA